MALSKFAALLINVAINRHFRGPFVAAILLAALVCGPRAAKAAADQSWSVKADYIESCSCSLFCSCYFNTRPEGGSMCDFNNAVKISEGHVGGANVDGVKFWLSGDLGGDFTKGMKAAVITLEPGLTHEQEDAVKFLVGKIYPVKWGSVAVDHSAILWEKNGTNGHAKLANGKGEVTLVGVVDSDGHQTVINDLKYWGAQSNTGFYLAKGTHWYKGFGHNYSFKDRNGFFIHIESSGS